MWLGIFVLEMKMLLVPTDAITVGCAVARFRLTCMNHRHGTNATLERGFAQPNLNISRFLPTTMFDHIF